MTAVGKIFVIFNMLLSLVVAGFIVMVYVARTNWFDAQKQWHDAATVAEASRKASADELTQARIDNAKALEAKDAEIKKLQGDVKAEQGKLVALQTDLDAAKRSGTGDNSSLQAVQTELEKNKLEVTGLEMQVKGKDKQIVDLIDVKNKANAEMVAAQIKANSFQGKAERMEARLRETETEIVKLRRTGGGGGTGGLGLVSTGNPPPQNVEGIVTEADAQHQLYKISIGSDAGLAKGHTLDVFRLTPAPQYLGQIRLTDVRAAEAVGTPVDKLKPVQKGDMVASDVLPKK